MRNFNRPTALAVGAIALMMGAIGPWITVLGFISAGPSNFTEVGLVVFGGIGLVIASALTRRYMRAVSIVVGLATLSEVGYVWFHLSEKDSSKIADMIQPGWGLFLSMFAGLFLVASTWIARPKVALANR